MSGQQDRWEQLDRWDQHDPRDAVTVDLSRLIERVQLELRADATPTAAAVTAAAAATAVATRQRPIRAQSVIWLRTRLPSATWLLAQPRPS